MRHGFERSRTGEFALLTVFLALFIAPTAEAGDGARAPDLESGSSVSPCDAPGQSCPRISGYIKAGADYAPGYPGGRAANGLTPTAPLPGSPGAPAIEPPRRGAFLLEVSHDDRIR